MGRFWKREHESHHIEALLLAHRPLPRPDFVHGLASRVSDRGDRPRFALSRVAFAAALSTLMLGTFASFGGLSYAADGAHHSLKAVKSVVTQAPRETVKRSPASDQYTSPPPVVTPPAGGGVSGAGGGGAGSGPAAVNATLPFTGFPLLLTAAIGLGFLALGLMLRRGEARR